MKCPHCLNAVHYEPRQILIGKDDEGHWAIESGICPACKRAVLVLLSGEASYGWDGSGPQTFSEIHKVATRRLIRPRGTQRRCPPEVPLELAGDFHEAALVIEDSPTASAALSRRCLQHLLRMAAQVKSGNLADEIQQVLDSKTLPPHVAENLDSIRNVGNFAAHPMKDKATDRILPVEPNEAEWNLDVLEGLFDFYFTQPARSATKRALLDQKLANAGKPPMKTP